MKIFVDSGDLEAIEAALVRGFVAGVTVTPWASKDAPIRDVQGHVGKIVELLRRHGRAVPISVELFGGDLSGVEREAKQFVQAARYEELSVKLPIGWDALPIIAALARDGIQVNCTCCVTLGQAVLAAKAGARYITVKRSSDLYDAASVMSEISQMLHRDDSQAELMVAGITRLTGIAEAIRAGADIVAVPAEFLQPMASHRRTDEMVTELQAQFEAWQSLEAAAPAAPAAPAETAQSPAESGTAK